MLDADIIALAAFAASVALTASSGAVFRPGAWYESLRKPSWTPPNWAFPAVWTALYVLIAWAGWRVWSAGGPGSALALGLYAVQLLLNAGWSAVFFGMRRMGWALIEVAGLAAAVAATIAAFAPIDPIAAGMMVPYLLWVCLAARLNYEVWRLNRPPRDGLGA